MSGLRSCLLRAALLPVAGVSMLVAAKGAPDRGIRFDDPRVLDLAAWSLHLDHPKPVAFGKLDAADSASISSAAAITEETPLQLSFSDDAFGCKADAPACVKEHEAKLLAQADGTVKRLDKRLVLAGAGQPVVFVDWQEQATRTAEGDEEKHFYLGRMRGNGYHRVEVQFGHDAPGNFLVNPKNGKVAFVHNAADIVAHTADGKFLSTFNSMNPPFSLRVGQLDDAGPKLVLMCTAAASDDKTSASFKGWRNDSTFDLVVHVGGADAKQDGARDVALRVTHGADGWSAAASDPARLAAAGVTCAQQ